MSLINEHNERDKIVYDFLNKVVTECNIVFYKDKEVDNFIIPLRLQLITTFSLLDVLASYHNTFHGLQTKKPSERFNDWMKEYCFVEENKEFSSNKIWQEITIEYLEGLRNSLVHFFGLKKECNGTHVSIANNNLSDIKIEEYRKAFKEKGIVICFIKPHSLHNLVKEGAKVMLKKWHHALETDKNNVSESNLYIKGIKCVFEKIESDGALHVDKDN